MEILRTLANRVKNVERTFKYTTNFDITQFEQQDITESTREKLGTDDVRGLVINSLFYKAVGKGTLASPLHILQDSYTSDADIFNLFQFMSNTQNQLIIADLDIFIINKFGPNQDIFTYGDKELTVFTPKHQES